MAHRAEAESVVGHGRTPLGMACLDQHADRAARRYELEIEIAAVRMVVGVEEDFDLLDVLDPERRRRSSSKRRSDSRRGSVLGCVVGVARQQRSDVGPGLRERHGCRRVDDAETVLVVDRVARTVERPIRVERIVHARAGGEHVPHVAPGQVRIGLQHERDHSRGERGRRRGPVERVGVVRVGIVERVEAVVVAVGSAAIDGRDRVAGSPARRRAHEHVGALLGVAGLDAVVADRAHGDHAAEVGVAVEVGAVAVGTRRGALPAANTQSSS